MTIEYLAVIPENIPQELKELKQWVVWKPEKKEGQKKPSKVSYSLQTNELTGNLEIARAAVNNPATWMTFDEALKLYKSKRIYKGLNFVFPSTSVEGNYKKIVGVDLDHIRFGNGDLNPVKIDEVKALNTYAEVSPSGSGLRAICYAEFPENEQVHKGDIEVYQVGKFLSITGHRLEGVPSTINPAQEAITAFRAKYFKAIDRLEEAKLPVTTVKFTDIEIIDKLANSSVPSIAESFRKLFYDGNIKTSTGKEDHSAADYQLCSRIVYWTQDQEQIDRIFRQSKLIREKWEQPDGFLNGEAVTYGQRTIRNACLDRKNVYRGSGSIQKPEKEQEQEQFELNLYPYKITTEGIFKKVPSKDDPQTLHDMRISSTPCKITALGDNVDTGEILYKLQITDAKQKSKLLWKAGDDLLTRAGVLQLIKDGMIFSELSVADMEILFNQYLQDLPAELPEEITASRSGWKANGSTFVVGNYGYTKDGVTTVLQLENNTAELYAQQGALEEWKVAANVMLKYDAIRFKFYTTCTPMLLGPLGIISFLQEHCAPSGSLKTLTGWFCASIWGNPVTLQMNAKSTPKGIEAFVGYNTDLPVFIDEVSTNEKDIKDMIYTIANGTGRGTSNIKHGYEMPKTWSTVVLTTGESPILPTNAKMGQLVRNVPLRGGVEEKLDQEIVATVETAIQENYGLFRELYIQKVFRYKKDLKTFYNKFRVSFATTDGVTDERAKKFYAAIATAGLLVEQIFKEIGIETRDPFEVVNSYFDTNVMSSTIFVPDYLRALDAVYSWVDANRIYFEETEGQEHQINHERYGWLRGEHVCFIPIKLEEFVTKAGYNYLGCLEEWKNHGILMTRNKKNKGGSVSVLSKTEIKDNGHNVQVIKIPVRKGEEEDTIKEKDDHKSKDDDDKMRKSALRKPRNSESIVSLDNYGEKVETAPVMNSKVVSEDEAVLWLEEEGL
jgi:uncharacterized protein (DUF927 family)